MKTILKYIKTICFGLLTVSLITGCFSFSGQTLSRNAHLVRLTGSVQRAVVKITTYDVEKKPIGIGRTFQMSAPVSQGSSGSPVINMHGKVIGVVSFISVSGQNLNFAVAGRSVLNLKADKTTKTMSEWTYSVSRQKPKLAAELCKKGFEFSIQGEYKKALEYYREAAEKSPDDAEAWLGLGSCYVGLEQPSAAIEVLKEATRFDANKTQAHYYLGRYYQELGRRKEAIESYQTAISSDRDYGPAYLGLAEIYSEQKRLNDEKETFEQLLRIWPDYAASHYNMGIIYAKLKRYQDAINAHKRALAIDPEIPSSYYNMGVMYGILGKSKEELAAYKQSIRIDPDFAPAHFNIGVLYIHSGQKDAALKEYKILKRLDKDGADKLFDLIYK